MYCSVLITVCKEIVGGLASSLTMGEVPEDWRAANLALFKKGKLRNYRPVS